MLNAHSLEIKVELILFLAKRNPLGSLDYFKKAQKLLHNIKAQPLLETEGLEKKIGKIAALLDWAISKGERLAFFEKLTDKSSKILADISYEEFIKKNGSTYPTALQMLGYKAFFVLIIGLRNPDSRLRFHYLQVLPKIKTGYNRDYILKRLYPFLKKEKHALVKKKITEVIEYFERK